MRWHPTTALAAFGARGLCVVWGMSCDEGASRIVWAGQSCWQQTVADLNGSSFVELWKRTSPRSRLPLQETVCVQMGKALEKGQAKIKWPRRRRLLKSSLIATFHIWPRNQQNPNLLTKKLLTQKSFAFLNRVQVLLS